MPDPVTVTDTIAEIERRLAAWEEIEKAATKGPWKITYGDNGYPNGIEAPGDAGVVGAVGAVVRRNGLGFPSGLAGQGNARLIAACPALVTASIPLWKELLKRIKEDIQADLYVGGILGVLLAAIPDPKEQ